jgi:hypothetical protein
VDCHHLTEKQQPAWDRIREFEISTRLVGWSQAKKSTFVDLNEEGMDETGKHELESAHSERKLKSTPARGG